MPFERLSQAELSADPDYVKFLKGLKKGEGARTTTKDEGVGKATIKQRLKRAAKVANVKIKFVRSDPHTVVLEVVG